jgi:hypothetical protein
MKKSTVHKVEAAVAIGAGIAAASIAGVLFFGRNGKENRKNLKAWSIKMKNDVVAKAKKLKTVTAPVYEKIVHEVAKKYEGMKEIGKDELQKEVAALKKEWHNAVKEAKKKVVSKVKSKKK